jgi:hypothetical protein
VGVSRQIVPSKVGNVKISLARTSCPGFALNQSHAAHHPQAVSNTLEALNMELFAQAMSANTVDAGAYGRAPQVPHFEALRQALSLPLATLVDDALCFQIGNAMKVTALLSERGQYLLLVELVELNLLTAEDWQRLVIHLSSHFDDERVGRLLVLDSQLCLAWLRSPQIPPDLWVQEAKQAMLWCLGARELVLGHSSPVEQ